MAVKIYCNHRQQEFLSIVSPDVFVVELSVLCIVDLHQVSEEVAHRVVNQYFYKAMVEK